jgi:hypothetical protein
MRLQASSGQFPWPAAVDSCLPDSRRLCQLFPRGTAAQTRELLAKFRDYWLSRATSTGVIFPDTSNARSRCRVDARPEGFS